MAGGSGGGRNLEETPTWAVATVCFVMILISIIIEHIFHLTGKWLKKKHKRALYESLEKIKSELMLLGFTSLLLTVGQSPISRMCISEKVADSWHPCSKDEEENTTDSSVTDDEESEPENSGRRLLAAAAFFGSDRGIPRRVLAGGGGGSDKCGEGKVPFVSSNGINQLHIFIFVLACFHVVCCILTMALGRAKMRRWKRWEEETKTPEYQFSHDPERFRFARDTSFGRRHLSFWTQNPILIWIVCFLRQFVWSVPKVDYLTLRHGFIMAHLSPQSHSNFDFRKYIKRSLDEDFKVVVGISPPLWFLAVLFLLFNTHGWNSYLWLPFIPLIIILLVGTKLQVIITKMGLSIQQRGEVLQGMPLVQPGDDLFWFKRPRLVLHLINFVFFQNAFQLAFLTWTALQFGIDSCFHSHKADVIIRLSMGVVVQILCSYVTLPLYALVTQMGSTMKPSIFNERVAVALRNWHRTTKRKIKRNRVGSVASMSVTSMSSRGTTPSHPMSPVHLLRFYRSEIDSFPASPMRRSNFDDTDSASASNSPHHHHQIEMGDLTENNDDNEIVVSNSNKEFSFDKRTTIT